MRGSADALVVLRSRLEWWKPRAALKCRGRRSEAHYSSTLEKFSLALHSQRCIDELKRGARWMKELDRVLQSAVGGPARGGFLHGGRLDLSRPDAIRGALCDRPVHAPHPHRGHRTEARHRVDESNRSQPDRWRRWLSGRETLLNP